MHTFKHLGSAGALVTAGFFALGSSSSSDKDSPVPASSAVVVPSAQPAVVAEKGKPLAYCEAKGGYECEDYTIFSDGTAEGQKRDCHGTYVAGAACPARPTLLGICTTTVMGLTRPKDGTSVEQGIRRIHSYKEGGNKDTTTAVVEELCTGRGGTWAAAAPPTKAAAPSAVVQAGSPKKPGGKK